MDSSDVLPFKIGAAVTTTTTVVVVAATTAAPRKPELANEVFAMLSAAVNHLDQRNLTGV